MMPMKAKTKALLVFSILVAIGQTAGSEAASPGVSNITVTQRADTKLVDIRYDLAADTPTVAIALEISRDDGVTFSAPTTAVTGDIGANIAVGTGKTMTWDAGVGRGQQYSPQTRFRVIADGALTPSGFSLIPAGTFTMGDYLMGGGGEHVVTLSAFYMGQKEVTKSEWDKVWIWAQANGYRLAKGGGDLENSSVHSISWYDAMLWCNARSEMEGLAPCYTISEATIKEGESFDVDCDWTANGYRLPSEAEWERAARGSLSGKPFPRGDTINHRHANDRADGSVDLALDTSGSTADIQQPTPNEGSPDSSHDIPFISSTNGDGLHDMAGNLWEWCWDNYGAYPMEAQTDPRGPALDKIPRWLMGIREIRVIRGGGDGTDVGRFRAANRSYERAGSRKNGWGFRLARSSVP